MKGLEDETDARRKSWSAWTKAVLRTGLNPMGSAERGAYGVDYWLKSADETTAGEWALEIGMFVATAYGINRSSRAGKMKMNKSKARVNSRGKPFSESQNKAIDNFSKIKIQCQFSWTHLWLMHQAQL